MTKSKLVISFFINRAAFNYPIISNNEAITTPKWLPKA